MLIIAAVLISLLAIHVDWSQGQDNQPYNFVFAVQWGIGACVRYLKIQDLNDCLNRTLQDKRWTIHGLWPDEEQNWEKPNNTEMNPVAEELMKEMTQFWPDILKEDNEQFWSYEYKKHGAIAVKNILWMDTQEKYFRLGLTLFNGLPFHNGNTFGGCIPRLEHYTVSELEQCMANNEFPRNTYRLRRTPTKNILYEIQICYRITGLNLANAQLTECKDNIMYPDSKDCVGNRKRRSAEDDICPLFLETEYSVDTECTTSAAGANLVDLLCIAAAAIFVMALVDRL